MKKIINFVESFITLNAFVCTYSYECKLDDVMLIKFDISSQCALFFALLHDMFIQNVVINLKDSNTIEIIDFSMYHNA